MMDKKKIHIGTKMTEKQFVEKVDTFLCTNSYVRKAECYFGGDNDQLADVELVLESQCWPEGVPDHLFLEAKCHHSKDSQNTIHKLFGQLLKETNKNSVGRQEKSNCLGILIPTDGAEWKDSAGTIVRRGSGIDYYREGFNRIKQSVYFDFGRIVDARYVLAFSVYAQELSVFDWNGFYAGAKPISILTGRYRKRSGFP